MRFAQYVPYSLFYLQLLLLQQPAELTWIALPDKNVLEADAFLHNVHLICRAIQRVSLG